MVPPDDVPDAAADELAHALAHTRAWVRHAVVGLNFCPFANAPFAAGRVRWVGCADDSPAVLRDVLIAEMAALAAADPAEVETTLVVATRALPDFLDFNDFLDVADDALATLGLTGTLQVASFHPDYRFAGTDASDLGNATNRSPYPVLQLLREASVERALAAFPDPDAIVDANLATLDALGEAGWAALEARCRAEALPKPP